MLPETGGGDWLKHAVFLFLCVLFVQISMGKKFKLWHKEELVNNGNQVCYSKFHADLLWTSHFALIISFFFSSHFSSKTTSHFGLITRSFWLRSSTWSRNLSKKKIYVCVILIGASFFKLYAFWLEPDFCWWYSERTTNCNVWSAKATSSFVPCVYFALCLNREYEKRSSAASIKAKDLRPTASKRQQYT